MLHASPLPILLRGGKSGTRGADVAIEIHGKTRHGLPGKFPTRRACVLFTDELVCRRVALVLLVRSVDYELRTDVAAMRSRGTLASRTIRRLYVKLIILRAKEKEEGKTSDKFSSKLDAPLIRGIDVRYVSDLFLLLFLPRVPLASRFRSEQKCARTSRRSFGASVLPLSPLPLPLPLSGY